MKTKTILFIFGSLIFLLSCGERERTCLIVGEVIDRPQSSNIILAKAFEDLRAGTATVIPIEEGRFSHEIQFIHDECYIMVFHDELERGFWRETPLFLNNGKVEVRLYNEDKFDQNTIVGGRNNRLSQNFGDAINREFVERAEELYEKMDSLEHAGNLYSGAMRDIYAELDETDDRTRMMELLEMADNLREEGLAYTAEGSVLHDQMDAMAQQYIDFRIDYVEGNKTVHSYYQFMRLLNDYKEDTTLYDMERIEEICEGYASRFPNHPYVVHSEQLLWSIRNIHVGGNYCDFTLNDLEGNEHTFSELADGKMVLLDIWAPWCGPCIAKSQSVKAIYDEIKGSDFIVVGVASKYETLESVKQTLSREQYPWITLIDEPERNSGINRRYGVESAGGKTVLIDKHGKIVAIDVSAAELKNLLSKYR